MEDKEKEISDTKDRLRQAKEEVIREYHDSDALLVELGSSFADCFNDYLRQVKTAFPDLDLSGVTIDAQAQTSVQLVHSESMDELFADDALVDDPHGDRENAPVESQIQLIMDDTRHINEVEVVEEKDEDTPVQQ